MRDGSTRGPTQVVPNGINQKQLRVIFPDKRLEVENFLGTFTGGHSQSLNFFILHDLGRYKSTGYEFCELFSGLL